MDFLSALAGPTVRQFPPMLLSRIQDSESLTCKGRRRRFSGILRGKPVAGLVAQHCFMDSGLVNVYDVHHCRS